MQWTTESIINLLMTNDQAVGRALKALYERQTREEQSSSETREHNGIGFTQAHAKVGSLHARKFIQYGHLFPEQLEFWRKKNAKDRPRIALYANQLLSIAMTKS